jgi:hypothetical protein
MTSCWVPPIFLGPLHRCQRARQLRASDHPAGAVPSGLERMPFRMATRKPFIHAVLDRLPKLRVAGSSPVPRSQKSPGKPGLFLYPLGGQPSRRAVSTVARVRV